MLRVPFQFVPLPAHMISTHFSVCGAALMSASTRCPLPNTVAAPRSHHSVAGGPDNSKPQPNFRAPVTCSLQERKMHIPLL
eukprot:3050309-Pleurochrysis_carterae.AAC.1